jgi:hypothetical protein
MVMSMLLTRIPSSRSPEHGLPAGLPAVVVVVLTSRSIVLLVTARWCEGRLGEPAEPGQRN